MKTIRLKLFGALQKYAPEPDVQLEVQDDLNVTALKRALFEFLRNHNPETQEALLMKDSVIATESGILEEEDMVPNGVTLAVLPPVCGG